MCDLKEVCNDLSNKKTIEIFGETYTIKNCVFATDGNVLKVSAYLISNKNNSLTLFTEVVDISKDRID